MRRYLKYFSSFILVPFTRWYLRKDRRFTYENISIIVKAGVFHPGLFYSTAFLLSYLKTQNLKHKKFLELGSGSGLISIFAARQMASVTASDISSLAVENTRVNAELNETKIVVIRSDLFTSINPEVYDFIVINPPYYQKKPITESEFAWFCGEAFEYFETLFAQLARYSNNSTQNIMVLTKGCDTQSIQAIARKNNFVFDLLQEKNVLFDEKDYLFLIKHISSFPANQA